MHTQLSWSANTPINYNQPIQIYCKLKPVSVLGNQRPHHLYKTLAPSISTGQIESVSQYVLCESNIQFEDSLAANRFDRITFISNAPRTPHQNKNKAQIHLPSSARYKHKIINLGAPRFSPGAQTSTSKYSINWIHIHDTPRERALRHQAARVVCRALFILRYVCGSHVYIYLFSYVHRACRSYNRLGCSSSFVFVERWVLFVNPLLPQCILQYVAFYLTLSLTHSLGRPNALSAKPKPKPTNRHDAPPGAYLFRPIPNRSASCRALRHAHFTQTVLHLPKPRFKRD